MNVEDARQALGEFERIIRNIKPNDKSPLDRMYAVLLTETEILKSFFMFYIYLKGEA